MAAIVLAYHCVRYMLTVDRSAEKAAAVHLASWRTEFRAEIGRLL